ncbi:hypothetical protein J4461_03280 [Candidatus Pacearchaeota archaeon]|nr:hypothetical protein [Candidatus Pacearchaeota archaeon]
MALLEKIVAVIMPDGFLPLKKPYRRSNPEQDGAALHLQQLYGSVLIEKSVSEENASEFVLDDIEHMPDSNQLKADIEKYYMGLGFSNDGFLRYSSIESTVTCQIPDYSLELGKFKIKIIRTPVPKNKEILAKSEKTFQTA